MVKILVIKAEKLPDSYENQIAKGELQTVHYKNPFHFESLDQLLLIMDSELDTVRFQKRKEKLKSMEEDGEAQNHAFQTVGEPDRFPGQERETAYGAFQGQIKVTVNRRDRQGFSGRYFIWRPRCGKPASGFADDYL
ncbi:MAG: hypothetical protein HFG80_13310 [Eubacterium sp.]|nr:hypothetical protein [Eubacterium sp.]